MRSRLSSIAFLIGLFAVVLAAFEGNFVPPTRPDPVLEKMSLIVILLLSLLGIS